MQNYSGIHKPLQKRSEQTAQRILDAFNTLLLEKSLDDITIQEICLHAKAGISSVYARFASKDAMLIALHERLTQTSVSVIGDLVQQFAVQLATADNPQPLLAALYRQYIAFARSNKHIYRAIMLSNHSHAYERIVAQTHQTSKSCFELLSRMSQFPQQGLEERVDVAVRVLSATFQQMWFLGDINPGRIEVSDDALATHLAVMTLRFLRED